MRRVVLVLCGGFCGTLARLLLSAPLLALATWFLPHGPAHFPYDIFFINLTGACVLGLLYGLFERGAALSPDVRLLVGTGFLGAYTTFSTFVYGGASLLGGALDVTAVAYLVGSIVLGVGFAQLGDVLAAGILRTHAWQMPVRGRWRGTDAVADGEGAAGGDELELADIDRAVEDEPTSEEVR